MAKKFYLLVFGCQMNVSDAERIAGVLASIGYKKTKKIENSDVIVLVMCSVRQSAVNRIYGILPKLQELKKKRKNLKILLTGCLLKGDRKKLERHFDYIFKIDELPFLPSFLLKNSKKYKRRLSHYLQILPSYQNKISAYVPIMTGCDHFCSYCVVPYTRGREVARPVKEIICEIKNLVKKGIKEIWLLGQNVNNYKDGKVDFLSLLKKIEKIKGNFWIRFISSHPMNFNEKLISFLSKSKKVPPYLNLPLQSGDNKILKLMNRNYTVKEYKMIVQKIREKIPDVAISTDIIVGFPTETKEEFQNTVNLFKEIKYDMAYISKYSPRKGTAAFYLKDDVPPEEKKQREKILSQLLKKIALEKNQNLIGKITTVLIMEKRKDGWLGRNEYYKLVKTHSKKNILGRFVKVKINRAHPFLLEGEIINE